MHAKKLVLFFGLSMTANLAMAGQCDAILQYGIFDRYNSLDFASRYNMAKSLNCGASSSQQGGSVGYEDISISYNQSHSKSYCSVSEQEAFSDNLIRTQVVKASEQIVSAWNDCVVQNRGGTSHYISPQDERKFVYRIQFQPDGTLQSTSLTSFSINGKVSCEGSMPDFKKPKTLIVTSSGIELSCTRSDPKETVVISAVTADGASNLMAIRLAAHVDAPPTLTPHSCMEIRTKPSGDYLVDPDGDGGIPSFRVYCLNDSQFDGGGWTLFAHHANVADVAEVEYVSPKLDFAKDPTGHVVTDDRWAVLRANMQSGMMFIDENKRMSRISKEKLWTGTCTNIYETHSLRPKNSNSFIFRTETSGCDGGGDYTGINLADHKYGNYKIAATSLYNAATTKFEPWPYRYASSYEDGQRELLYFIR